jgi:hypothetical protein
MTTLMTMTVRTLIGLKSWLRIRINFIRIRIQHFRLNTDPDPDPIRGFNDQKLKKIQLKKIIFFLIKNYNLPIPRPPQRTSKLQEKPSDLKRGLQHFNT